MQKMMAEIDILSPVRGSSVFCDADCCHVVDINRSCGVGEHPYVEKRSTDPKRFLGGGSCCDILSFADGERVNCLF